MTRDRRDARRGACTRWTRPTDWWFEHGATEQYGRETAAQDGAGRQRAGRPSRSASAGFSPRPTTTSGSAASGRTKAAHCGTDRHLPHALGRRCRRASRSSVAFTDLVEPHGRALRAGRPRVRGRAPRRDQGLRRRGRHHARRRSPTCGRRCTRSGTAGCSGSRSTPTSRPSRSCTSSYTHDAPIGGTAPRWGTVDGASDGVPERRPGPTGDGCVVSGRISRLTADGNSMTGPEQVLVEDWCQQYPSHSVGSLAFGPDGSLYASGGDGASFNTVDYGQFGSPKNPCGDPPGEPGDALTPPTAEGGALRSQDLRSSGDPGRAERDGDPDRPGDGRGHGRQPGRVEHRPQRPPNRGPGPAQPVPHHHPARARTRSGSATSGGTTSRRSTGCRTRRTRASTTSAGPASRARAASPATTAPTSRCARASTRRAATTSPFLLLPALGPGRAGRGVRHRQLVDRPAWRSASTAAGRTPPSTTARCSSPTSRAAASGCSSAPGGTLPEPQRALDVPRARAPTRWTCRSRRPGELFYVDFHSDSVRRIVYSAGNRPPKAVATADRTDGALPLTVGFDGSTSDDPDSEQPTHLRLGPRRRRPARRLVTRRRPAFTYSTAGHLHRRAAGHGRRRRLGDRRDQDRRRQHTSHGHDRRAQPGRRVAGRRRRSRFRGAGADEQDGDPASVGAVLDADAASTARPTATATRVQSWQGDAEDSFDAPDHEYPSHLELRLTARDSGGLTDTPDGAAGPADGGGIARVEPLGPEPHARLVVGDGAVHAHAHRGRRTSIAAPSPQTQGGNPFVWRSWSDGGARAHDVTVNDDATFRATFGPP